MLPDLILKIQLELQCLHKILDENKELILHVQTKPPTGTERSALALMLQSFYTGFENIFSRISKEIDGGFQKSKAWHVELLFSMTSGNKKRHKVISDDVSQRLHPSVA